MSRDRICEDVFSEEISAKTYSARRTEGCKKDEKDNEKEERVERVEELSVSYATAVCASGTDGGRGRGAAEDSRGNPRRLGE